MDHISLYRKWRPQTFEEVVGQPHVTNTLENALSSGRLVHAYLFCGPRGTGKTSTARILAKAINCVEGPTATPCNRCEACISIAEGTALDVIEIDAASNRKIDEIRDLLEKIPYSPTSLRTKVYIVDEVHQLTAEASSALLKTLEEPPSHVIFVLATTEAHKILPTIVSRCQRFDFSLVSAADLSERLALIASTESIEVEDEALAMIAEHAHGSVRDAIGVMDQIANLSGEKVTGQQVAELLGEVESELIFEIVGMIAEKDTAGALTLVGRLVEDGKDPRRFVESLIAHLRSLFLIQNAANPREIVEATDEHFERLTVQAGYLKRYEVVRLIERLGETHRDMRYSENARLALECALVKATTIDADVSLEGLLFRLEELEKRVAAGSGGGAPTKRQAPAKKPVAAREKDARKEKEPAPVMVEEAEGETPVGKKESSSPDTASPALTPREVIANAAAVKKGTEVPTAELDKARRAWAAVVAELKNQGNTKLYALLTRVKVVDIGDDRVVLGFKGESSFQLEVLAESGDIALLESLWERFFGKAMKLDFAGETDHPAPRRRVPTASKKTPARPEDNASTPRAETGGQRERQDDPGPARAGASGKDIARMLKESFDGEIIESSEGKE